MEFHLPYLALRTGDVVTDKRKKRRSQPMLRTIEALEAGITEDDIFYYEAQTSFLITGVDEWQWTAYCCVDTFFDGEFEPESYYRNQFDGPIGGSRQEFQPVWNPREYFLIVFSRRLSQVSKEWKNITDVLNDRLNTYVRMTMSIYRA
jgi:hypothetical protein